MIRDWQNILQKVLQFRNERDWEQYHTPKNLVCSISIEASELLELFQWLDNDEGKRFADNEGAGRIREEVADIAIYLMLFCHDNGIDLEDAMLEKLKMNAEKYPVGKSKGSADKYDRF